MIFSSSSKNRSSRLFLIHSSTAEAREVCMSINLDTTQDITTLFVKITSVADMPSFWRLRLLCQLLLQNKNKKNIFFNNLVIQFYSLKGVCHEIFYLHFFHDSNPSRPMIYRLKHFRIRFRFRWDIRSQSSKNSTSRCAWHSRVKIIGLANLNFFFISFLS